MKNVLLYSIGGFLLLAMLLAFRFNAFISLELINSVQLTFISSVFSDNVYILDGMNSLIHSLGYFAFAGEEINGLPLFARKLGFKHYQFIHLCLLPVCILLLPLFMLLMANFVQWIFTLNSISIFQKI